MAGIPFQTSNWMLIGLLHLIYNRSTASKRLCIILVTSLSYTSEPCGRCHLRCFPTREDLYDGLKFWWKTNKCHCTELIILLLQVYLNFLPTLLSPWNNGKRCRKNKLGLNYKRLVKINTKYIMRRQPGETSSPRKKRLTGFRLSLRSELKLSRGRLCPSSFWVR